MGLDITCYSQITELDCVYDVDGEPIDPQTRHPIDDDTYFTVYINPDFPGRADELKDKHPYSYARSFGFRAGSYSGYNEWREELAKMAGYPKVATVTHRGAVMLYGEGASLAGKGPFFELIHFSDCEGTIGAAVASKLSQDFADFQSAADAIPDEWFRSRYADWRKGLEMAANNGAVRFW